MTSRQTLLGWLSLATCVLWGNGRTPAADPQPVDPRPRSAALSAEPPLERLPVAVQRIMANPTVRAQGPREVFRGRKAVYEWLLDHPDQGVQILRRLGARCMATAALPGRTARAH